MDSVMFKTREEDLVIISMGRYPIAPYRWHLDSLNRYSNDSIRQLFLCDFQPCKNPHIYLATQ
jgi:hypothetical protein